MGKSEEFRMKQQIEELISNLEIRGIQLVASSFGIAVPPEFLTPERVKLELNTEFSANVNRSPTGDASEIMCFVGATVVGRVAENDPLYKQLQNNGSILNGACSFVVRYNLRKSKNVTNTLAMELAKTQGIFNAFPYIRNYVDSQFMQMGVTGIMLPLVKRQPPEKESKQAAQL